MLSGTQDAGSNQVQGRTRILPASEVLLSLAGSGNGSSSRMNVNGIPPPAGSRFVIDVKLTSWWVKIQMQGSKTSKKHSVSSLRFAMMMDIRLERWKCRVRIVMLCFLRRMCYTHSCCGCYVN